MVRPSRRADDRTAHAAPVDHAASSPDHSVAVPAGERLAAAAAAAVLSPAIAVRAAVAKARTGRVFDEHHRFDRQGRPITIRSFASDALGRRLAYLFSVAGGDVRIIGPQPRRTPAVQERTPGFLSAHRLRARTGIDYAPEPAEMEQGLLKAGNAALLARYVVAEVLTGGERPTPPTLTVLGVKMANATMDQTLEWIAERAHTPGLDLLAFVNVDCLNQAVTNPSYRDVLHRAERVVPDGIGVKLGARMHGADVLQNVNGTDMFPLLCEMAAERDLPIFLLGGREGIAEAAADAMRERIPGVPIVGTHHGYFADEDSGEIVRLINDSGAKVLLVAFGVPKQELWIDAHRADLTVGVASGVGGLLDFYSGRIPRAPLWLREIGLEWTWRLAQEPGRMWRRYVVGNPLFLTRVRKETAGAGHRAARPQLLNYPEVTADE